MGSKREGYDTNLSVSFLWPFKTAIWLIVIFLSLAFLNIVFALFFDVYVWDQPVISSQMLLDSEIKRINAISEAGTVNLSLLTEFTQRWTYWLFFQATTIHDSVYAYLYQLDQVNEVDQMYLSKVVGRYLDEIYVVMNTIQIFGIRIGLFIASIPLFILVYLTAMSDGLTERYIRRACAGRESSDLFKIGRLSKLGFFSTGMTIYFCVPINISSHWIIMILVLVMAVATRVQWQYFKKYL